MNISLAGIPFGKAPANMSDAKILDQRFLIHIFLKTDFACKVLFVSVWISLVVSKDPFCTISTNIVPNRCRQPLEEHIFYTTTPNVQIEGTCSDIF